MFFLSCSSSWLQLLQDDNSILEGGGTNLWFCVFIFDKDNIDKMNALHSEQPDSSHCHGFEWENP